MTINIGTNIKNLRTKKQVTQKQLATYLGVTEQAVSRWESGGGYPDIQILPSIASFFAVTTDELLGMNMTEREKRLEEIRVAMKVQSDAGEDDEEAVAQARLWAAEFPGEEEIQKNLADELCRYTMWDEKPKMGLLKESEKIYRTLIETTQDGEFRNEVLEALAALYGIGFRDTLRAEETADQLPQMKYCREQVKSAVFQTIALKDPDTDFWVYTQDYIEKLTDSLGWTLAQYVIKGISNSAERWDEKIGYFEKILDLYKLVFGENMLLYHERAAYICRIIATYTVAQGKSDETCGWLEQMTDHAIAAGEAKAGDKYTSPFMNRMVYPGWTKDFDVNIVHNSAYYCREKMNQDRYDSIREMPRFKAIVARLDEAAK